MPDFSSIDFVMPEGLTNEERVAWLHEIGAKLKALTGQKSGTTPTIDVGAAQPVWFTWHSDDD